MLTLLLIFFPLAAALVLFLFRPQQAKIIALAAALIELVLSLVVVAQFNKAEGPQFEVNVPWITSMGLNFAVAIDGISLLLVLLTTVLVPFIILSSFSHTYDKPSSFYGLILTMQMALVGVFVARDGLLFYLFWEVALIPIYFICLIWGGEDRGRITFKFFVYTLAGSLFMLVGLVYLYFHTPGSHTFAIDALYQAGHSLSATEQSLLFWALFVAFAIKMPVFPFHTWQPDTYTVSPVQGTMLLSGIMLKMGIYGVIRWLIPVVPGGVAQWGMTAVIISVIGIIYASCIAIVQKDFKRLIAYSSIAHVGLISAGIFTRNAIGIQGAMIQMVSHGIIVFALFYIIEIVFDRTKTRTLSELGGIRNVAPVLATVFVITMLGSVALPFTSGFVGEFLLINALFQYKAVLGAIAGVTIILGAVYMLRTFQKSMSGETNSKTASFLDLTGQEKLVLYPIVILIILIGIYPAPLLEISEAAVTNLLHSISEVTASAN
ncbi:MAG TPA: NADH-quinone oxidoreductase subunit M [Ohtaekwangia sp.]|uniref:complex I subunit 4 family protein n=1 Tax=Ohtaekwangia sp. TaxID=2066019 RepID=UPI002F950BA7